MASNVNSLHQRPHNIMESLKEKNRIVQEMTRVMLHSKNIPLRFGVDNICNVPIPNTEVTAKVPEFRATS